MRRILVCTGVLGGGTAIVFALAALTATLFPTGTKVGASWNGGVMVDRAWGVAVPAPLPAVEPPAPVVDRDGFKAVDEGFKPLPGDIVQTDDGGVILEAVPEP